METIGILIGNVFCNGSDPQTDTPCDALLAGHLHGNHHRFQDLASSLAIGPHIAAAFSRFANCEDGSPAPCCATAIHVVGTVWRSLIPAWDDRLAGRVERPTSLRYEDEIVASRVAELLDFDLLMARYEEIVLASGEVPLDVLTDVAVAEMTVALSMEWVEQADGSWRNDEIPGLAMVVERLGECWCWHVSGGKGAFRANYGVSSAMFEACNKAIEAVTGIDPSDDYLPLGNLGVI